MDHQDVELLAIGAGPSNLALAVALEELAPADLAERSLLIERHGSVAWQRGMLLPWAQSQVSFLKDLATLRNPRSEFTFINYLHATGRLDQFVNLGTFTPYRLEISNYLRWVAGSLARVRIDYDRTCLGIEPVRSAGGDIDRWLVRLAGGATITCRHLVIGSGREPHLPDVFAALPRERLVHSTEFSAGTARLDPAAPHRVVIIGGAQSAAEMLMAAHQMLPRAECTMIMRSIGLQSYEHSKFANELYYPSFVDDFFSAGADARRRLLGEMQRTNYGALDPELLDDLYRQMYLDRLTGSERLRMVTMTDVADARMDGGDVVLTLTDRRGGGSAELRCDVVLLGTGFVADMPGLIRELAKAAGLDDIEVTRAYRLIMPAPSPVTCHLQGVNEATHGIADSLLSVIAVRAGEIVDDLLAHRAGAAADAGRWAD